MITNLFSALLVLATNTTPIYSHPDLCEVRADGIKWCNGGIYSLGFNDCNAFEGFYDKDSEGTPICVFPDLEKNPPEYHYYYDTDK